MRTLATSLALILSVAGCGEAPPVAPLAGDAAAGTYTLKTVDGSALPFVYLEAPGWKDEITSGIVELRADGRFRDESLYRRTRAGATTMVTITVTGAWARRDDVITFRATGDVGPGRLYTMRLDGGRLILVEVGLTSVFER
jgi:hypothetical protein